MARIRTIKPTHWADKALAGIPLEAHLLWIGTWNFADDEGVFENDPLLIRSNIFPRRTDISIPDIEGWLKSLVEAKFIIPFIYNSESYFIHRTFKSHQKIDRPQGSKIPKEEIRRILDECSTIVRPCIVEESSVVESITPADSPQVHKKPKKVSTKKNEDSEPYWQKLVDEWFFMNQKIFGAPPSFTGKDARELKKLIGLLKARAKLKQVEWTESIAIQRFTAFMEEAYKDQWISKNFLLNNLVSQFDKIILNHSQHGAANRKNSTGTIIPITGGKSAGAIELINRLKDNLAAINNTGG